MFLRKLNGKCRDQRPEIPIFLKLSEKDQWSTIEEKLRENLNRNKICKTNNFIGFLVNYTKKIIKVFEVSCVVKSKMLSAV